MFWKKRSTKTDLEILYNNCKKYKWQQHRYCSYSKQPFAYVGYEDKLADTFCVVGLICRTRYELNKEELRYANITGDPMYKSLMNVVPRAECYTLEQYNDDVAKSKDDILRLIKTAIEMQR